MATALRHYRIAILGLLLLVALITPAGTGLQADTGDPVLIGTFNSSDARTTLRTDSAGASLRVINRAGAPGLSLVVDDGVAPLKVNSNRKVNKLNADLLDGRNSSFFAKRPQVVQRVATCAAAGFGAISSSMSYATANLNEPGVGVHIVRVADEGTFFGDCSLDIPPGATITDARFVVWDDDASNEVNCWLFKVPLGGAAPPIFSQMTPQLSSGIAAAPGPGTVLETATITDAVVAPGDAITADCWMAGSTGIEGAAITYEVMAVPETSP